MLAAGTPSAPAHVGRRYAIHTYKQAVPPRVVENEDVPSDDELFDMMREQNPWWDGGRLPDDMRREYKRADYAEMLEHLDSKDYSHHVHALIGARGVGKTTVLQQLVDSLVSSGDPKRVILLALDEESLFPSAGNLRRMVDLYVRRVLREPRHRISQRAYIVLDEVQEAKNWQVVLKNMVDRRSPLTFVVSCSSTANLFATSKPLLGRIRHQIMSPMSFAEYSSFKDRPYADSLLNAGARMRGALAKAAKDGNAGVFHKCVEESRDELALAKNDVLLDLSEYMTYGGCPGIAAASGHKGKNAQLKLQLRMSLYQDIVKAGGVRNPWALAPLFALLAKRSPRLINKEGLARHLGINKITLDAYLALLEAAHLVSYSEMYGAARARTEKKAYVNDAGMRNTANPTAHIDALSDSDETGLLAESIAGDHTRRLWESIDPAAFSYAPRYWRGRRGDEVDLVMDLQNKPVPIEVKYRRRVRRADLGGLYSFADKFGSKVALAITQHESGAIDGGVVLVPLWLYLAMCP